jgi:hypothetical protein
MVMASTSSDPTQNPTGPGSAPDSGSGSTISRAEHEAALAAERRRQGGLERERRKQDQRIAELEARLDSGAAVTDQDRQGARAILAAMRPDDPARRALEILMEDNAQWKGYVHQEATTRKQQQAQSALDAAIADAVKNGVPYEELADLDSPTDVKATAKEFLREKRISDLEKELKAERDGRGLAVQDTRNQTRAELGASVPSTVVGNAVPLRNVDDQIAAVQQEIKHFYNLGDQNERMSRVHDGNQALNLLRQWKARGNNSPMPAGWRP